MAIPKCEKCGLDMFAERMDNSDQNSVINKNRVKNSKEKYSCGTYHSIVTYTCKNKHSLEVMFCTNNVRNPLAKACSIIDYDNSGIAQ